MEAIEFSLAEYGQSSIRAIQSTPKNIASTLPSTITFSSFCPMFGRRIIPDGPMDAVEVESVLDGKHSLVPAELVFIPHCGNVGQRIFGESSNGLSSGNSILEASLHGVCELMERDVQALDFIHDRSVLVDTENVTPDITELIDMIEGITLYRSHDPSRSI